MFANMLSICSQFLQMSQKLLWMYLFSLAWANSTLFVVVLPRCMTQLVYTLTNFSLTGHKIVVSTYSMNSGQCEYLYLNVFRKELYSSSDAESMIFSHVVFTFGHTSLVLKFFPNFAYLKKFAFTFIRMWY
jgi:hypothetical protein